MAEIRLITTNEIVKRTPLGGNVGKDKYVFLIDDIQVMVLEPILGTKLYNKIQEDYNTNSLTGLYLTIHEEYIVPFLAHAVFSDYTRNGNYRIRNNGNIKHEPNNATSTSNDEDTQFVMHQMAKAERYLNKLERFLCVEGNNIPEYTQTQDNEYDTKPKDNKGYNVTWFL